MTDMSEGRKAPTLSPGAEYMCLAHGKTKERTSDFMGYGLSVFFFVTDSRFMSKIYFNASYTPETDLSKNVSRFRSNFMGCFCNWWKVYVQSKRSLKRTVYTEMQFKKIKIANNLLLWNVNRPLGLT